MKPGIWYLYSKSDPRWCVSGETVVGMWGKPQECDEAQERLTQELGEPPADLHWGYEKY